MNKATVYLFLNFIFCFTAQAELYCAQVLKPNSFKQSQIHQLAKLKIGYDLYKSGAKLTLAEINLTSSYPKKELEFLKAENLSREEYIQLLAREIEAIQNQSQAQVSETGNTRQQENKHLEERAGLDVIIHHFVSSDTFDLEYIKSQTPILQNAYIEKIKALTHHGNEDYRKWHTKHILQWFGELRNTKALATEDISLMIRMGADTNEGPSGMPMISKVATDGDLQEIDNLILNYQADPNRSNSLGDTPLHLVMTANKLVTNPREVIELLIKRGANINKLNPLHHSTPIHWAVMMQSAENVQTLLDLKADLTIRNKDGLTPLGYARKIKKSKGFNHQEISAVILILEQAGAPE